VSGQRVEDERPRAGQNVLGAAENEQRANAPALATLLDNLDRQVENRL
jgi:hypothetical protein